MPALSEKKRYTYKEYAALPEGSPYQLIEGELIMTPSPAPYHQMISLRLATALANHVSLNKAGLVFTAPIDVYLDDEDTYQPDIIVILKERTRIVGEKRIEGAPDVVVEILSPSTAYYDLRKKFYQYEKHGVKEYWIVDPELKTVDIYENKGGKFVQAQSVGSEGKCTSGVVAGFQIDAHALFDQSL
ncbi:MAG: restriction endonuclease [Nitrospirae bacterium GWC2_57_13]|nr:MAG: restriction endonuclease [Nitrospirae bacterium GWC2_57_13]HAS53380.1 restriction endonuclease [Nitrospiraceae bacterium]